jgi:hypothetical protein
LTFSPDSYDNPFSRDLAYSFMQFSVNLYKKKRLFFQQNVLVNDQGWIFPDIFKEGFISLANENYDIDFNYDSEIENPLDNNAIFATTIYLMKNHFVYHMSYMKVQDLAALCGGFMDMVFLLCQLLIFEYNSFSRDIGVINQIFEFEGKHLRGSKSASIFRSFSKINLLLRNNNSNKSMIMVIGK